MNQTRYPIPSFATCAVLLMLLWLTPACDLPNGCVDWSSDRVAGTDQGHHSSLAEALIQQGQSRFIQYFIIGSEVRRGIEANAPSTFKFTCPVPQNADLHLSHGLVARDWEHATTRTAFSIHLRDRFGDLHRIYHKTVPGEEEIEKDWIGEIIPLDDYAGQVIDLIVQVMSPHKDPGLCPGPLEGIPVWSGVRVLSRDSGAREGSPNFLWITIDALRRDHVGLYGYDRPTTPAIDALAEEGVVFDCAISTSPWTRPSVASMMMSAYPHQICSPDCNCMGERFFISDDLPTLPGILREAGYRTVAFVNNPMLDYSFGCARGFSSYFQCEQDPETWSRLDSWLGAHRDSDPFFVYLHLFGAHIPYEFLPDVSEAFIGEERGRALALRFMNPGLLRDLCPKGTELDGLIRLYDGKILASDMIVGKVIARLDQLGLTDRTFLVITSDHGEEFNDHGGWEHGHSLYDEVIRVPLILVRPGLEQSRRVSEVVSLTDIAPTILHAAGLEPPASFMGQSLPAAPEDRGRMALSENLLYGMQASSSVRTNRFKYILERGSQTIKFREKLYDLSEDASESVNLAVTDAGIGQGRDLYLRFQQRLAHLSGRTTACLKFVSAGPREWSLEIESDQPAVPVIDIQAAHDFSWKIDKDFTRGKMEFKTDRGTPVQLQFPLTHSLEMLRVEVELDGRPIKEGEVITARPGSESKLPVLANLCSKEARRSLFTMSEPEPPTDRSASLIIWTASPNSSSLGGANQYELKERLRSLGYVDY